MTMEMTSLAEASRIFSAALQSVPQVSAMSSIRMAVLCATSPVRVMRDITPGWVRSLLGGGQWWGEGEGEGGEVLDYGEGEFEGVGY